MLSHALHDSPESKTAAQGHVDVASLLLRASAAVDAQDKDGWTPLVWAAQQACCRHKVPDSL